MSNIEWTGKTWNLLSGCKHVSEGCLRCYAEQMSYRLERMGQEAYAGVTRQRRDSPGAIWTGKVTLRPERLKLPLSWKPQRIFVCSMSDLFHEDVPFDFIQQVFDVMAKCPEHTFQVLTHRPERMRAWFDAHPRHKGNPLPNVHLGATVELEKYWAPRMRDLFACPAARHFVSLEPLLGAIDMIGIERYLSGPFHEDPDELCFACGGRLDVYREPRRPCAKCTRTVLDWVIVGGESGRQPRPCALAWIEWIVAQCKQTNTPCFVKQLGSNSVDVDEGALVRTPGVKGKGGNPEQWPQAFPREMP